MFLNSNLNKPSLVKPIVIIVAVLLVIGGAYTFFGKKSDVEKASADQAGVQSSGLDKGQKVGNVGDVEEVVAKWIEANPQAIITSVSNMQRKVMEDQMKTAQKNIGPKKDELFNDKNSPVYAPKGYNVAIVEFFDYNCGYCKKTNSVIEELVKADPKVKIIYKEFPILGQASEEISSIALAINIVDPAAYKKFHDAMMNSAASSKEEVMKIVANSGANVAKVESTLKSHKDKIAAMIAANRALGGAIGVNGTPGFVLGEELVPGAVSLEMLQQKIAEQRKK